MVSWLSNNDYLCASLFLKEHPNLLQAVEIHTNIQQHTNMSGIYVEEGSKHIYVTWGSVRLLIL